MTKQMHGVFTVPTTPFGEDGKHNLDRLTAHVDEVLETGVQGILCLRVTDDRLTTVDEPGLDLISRDEGSYCRVLTGGGRVRAIPAGFVGAVLPWTYPIAMLGWTVAPALAVGDAMIIEPSEGSTLSGLHFAQLEGEAGTSDEVLQVLTGIGPTIRAARGPHPDIDVLTVTGSWLVGRSYLESSARSNLKQVSLKLGRRAGYIVDTGFAADPPAIAENVAHGRLRHSRSAPSMMNPTGWRRPCSARTSTSRNDSPSGSGWAPRPSTATAKPLWSRPSADCARQGSGGVTTVPTR